MTNLEKDIKRATTISKNLLTEVERTGQNLRDVAERLLVKAFQDMAYWLEQEGCYAAALVMAATPMAQPFNHEKALSAMLQLDKCEDREVSWDVVCSMMALTSLVLMNLAASTNTERLPNCVTSIVTVLLQINAKLGKPFPANDIMCAALNA